MQTDGIEKSFEDRISSIDSIFSSFKDLHEIYTQVLSGSSVNPNSLKAFERLKSTASNKQQQISNRLYSQAFILLTGTAEALLKDVFEDLLVNNFATISGAAGFSFSTKELQQAIVEAGNNSEPLDSVSRSLGHLIMYKIFKGTNPSEKINFQNVKTMKSVFEQYFDIVIPDSENLDALHRYWQVRHVLVHNNGVIDERFTHNVKIVNLLKANETVGSNVTVTKKDFVQARKDFASMFSDLGVLIASKGLTSQFVA